MLGSAEGPEFLRAPLDVQSGTLVFGSIKLSPELLEMVVNEDGDYRVVRLQRLTGKREVVGSAKDPNEAYDMTSRLNDESHQAFIDSGSLIILPSSQPNSIYFSYTPDGRIIQLQQPQ